MILTGLGVVDVLIMLLVAVVWAVLSTVIVWKWVVPYFFGEYVKRTIITMLKEPDDDVKGALGQIFMIALSWAGSQPIKTGEKVKVASDKLDAEDHPIYIEQDEVLTPIDLLARTIGNYAIMKMKGQAGGVKTQLNRVLQEGLQGEGALPLSPAALKALSKGQLGPALTEALLPELMKRLSSVKGDKGTGGSSW